MSKVELVKAKTFELDPTKKYLIILPAQDFTEYDAQKVNEQMQAWGAKSSVLLASDPKAIKITESK